ncbi:FAD-dependent monooxygenase [Pusillimonas noertemannii]|uniref:FAD-dependent monooxygenase n=1 Tax=Pusillimonas noertemannii TaxID=305977 RepID=UPI003340D9DE
MKSNTRIAVVGGGLGGLAAARLLQKAGVNAQVYEQAPSFLKLGAGIHISPNVMKVMRAMGIEKELEAVGSSPDRWRSRDGVSGEILFEIALGDIARQRFGASYLTVRRGDFHELMLNTLQSGTIHFGKKLVELNDDGHCITLNFEDGTTDEADLVIGADGINSKIREKLLGPERPNYTGDIAHRAMFSAKGLKGFESDQCSKWWSGDRHIVIYYVDKHRDEIYYVTGVPYPQWNTTESWLPSSRDEMREAFAGWHPAIQSLIDATQEVTKWPLMDRNPLPIWSEGRLVMLGDACHPMKPHMAQGAGMAIEDAAMLVRCLQETGLDNHEAAFQLYKANRSERATRVQRVSKQNSWLRFGEDPSWCFGYDVFEVPLVSAESRQEHGLAHSSE